MGLPGELGPHQQQSVGERALHLQFSDPVRGLLHPQRVDHPARLVGLWRLRLTDLCSRPPLSGPRHRTSLSEELWEWHAGPTLWTIGKHRAPEACGDDRSLGSSRNGRLYPKKQPGFTMVKSSFIVQAHGVSSHTVAMAVK